MSFRQHVLPSSPRLMRVSVITKKQYPFLFPWKHGWSSLFTPQTSHCPIWRGTRSSCPRFAGTSSFFTFGAVPHHRALNSSAFSNSIKQNSLRRTFAFCVSTWMILKRAERREPSPRKGGFLSPSFLQRRKSPASPTSTTASSLTLGQILVFRRPFCCSATA